MRSNFQPAGEVSFASFAAEPPLFTQNKTHLTKVQKDGLRYEKRVQIYLESLCRANEEFACLCNPWIIFGRKGDSPTVLNLCQPDCLVINRSARRIIIVEAKLSHTPDSWRQIRQLYEPVVKKIFPAFSFSFLEICKWFDPHIGYPETYYYAEHVLEAEEGKIGIHIYKPRGREKK